MRDSTPLLDLIRDRYGLTPEQVARAIERYTIISQPYGGIPRKSIRDNQTGEKVFTIRGWVLTMDPELERKLVELARGL